MQLCNPSSSQIATLTLISLLYLPLDDGGALGTAIGDHNLLDDFGLGIRLILVSCLPRGCVLMLLGSCSLFGTHHSLIMAGTNNVNC